MSAARADVRTTNPPLNREMWFADKIARASGERFCGIFAGTTDPTTRSQRARELILKHQLAARRVIPNRPDSFADCFQRLYGEPLTASPDTSQPLQFEAPV